MKRKRWSVFLCVFLLFGCSACKPARASGSLFIYEGEGFGSEFNITLNKDHTFTYYEGMLSSTQGCGSWDAEGKLLTLTETDESGHGFVFRFEQEEDSLRFLAEGSDNFLHIKVQDGERFYLKNE